MRLTQQQLRQIIKEEISKALKEATPRRCSKKDLKDIRQRKKQRRQSLRIGDPGDDGESGRKECIADRKTVKGCGLAWDSEGDYC